MKTIVNSLHLFLVLAVIFVLDACTDFPADPKYSFDNAKTSGLKVGIAVNPPFTMIQNGRTEGTEVTLIEKFARAHNLDINYKVGTESQLINQLKDYRLHILAGGFDKTTIWISKAGLTVSYDGRHVLLVPKGENQLLYRLEKHIFEAQ